MEGEGMLQSINHIFISLLSSYPISLCTFVPPHPLSPPPHTHTHTHTHTLRHTVVKCSSCVKCQAGLFSDIRFEPIQMLPFLHFTREKRGGEGQEEQESTWLEGWRRRGRRTAGEGLWGIWGNKDKNSETYWGYHRQLRERFCHKLQYRGKC